MENAKERGRGMEEWRRGLDDDEKEMEKEKGGERTQRPLSGGP